jgi:hypothetical protein
LKGGQNDKLILPPLQTIEKKFKRTAKSTKAKVMQEASMTNSEWVLKAILNRYPAVSRESLERFLPKTEKARLDAMPSTNLETDVEEPPLLERVHWSWLLPMLESLSLRDQKLLLSALPSHTKENLCRELKIKTLPKEELSKSFQEFAAQTLTDSLTGEPVELLPVYFLPPTPLSRLLHLDKQKLVQLIDSLALNDLAWELRQIVETKILKKIYSFLSEEEKKSLKKAASIQKPFAVSRLPLEKWNGTEKSFRLLLHKRGLARLGAALSTQHRDFIWYVCHQLDIGRGKALEKLSKSESAKGTSLMIIHQIEELLQETLS